MPVDAAASSPSVPELRHRIELLEAALRAPAAELDDPVGVAAFLANDVTGADMRVDGGLMGGA